MNRETLRQQERDRRVAIANMRNAGHTFKKIGVAFGISEGWARQLLCHHILTGDEPQITYKPPKNWVIYVKSLRQ